MGLENVKSLHVPVVIGGVEYDFFYGMGAAAHLSEKFGSVVKAQVSLNEACFRFEDGVMVPVPAVELFTAKFFEVLREFTTAMLLRHVRNGGKPIDLFDLGAEELTPILEGIMVAVGYGNPVPKESGHSKGPQKP